MTTEQRSVARVSRRFNAPAERVFDAFTDLDTARRFLYASNAGEIIHAELDPRPGGTFVMTDRRDGVPVEHRGTFLEIDRPRHLAFTFFVPGYSRVPDRVTLDITPLESGCELTLTHSLEPDYVPFLEATEQAYTEHLNTLATVLAG